MLQNGSFTEGWETLPHVAGYLRNQRPHGWQLAWLEKGDPLYSDPNSHSGGVPECVHKLSKQLPANEQLGGTDALILSGDTVYKIFHANAPFGATLSQTVTGLNPHSEATLTVPIQIHLHNDSDTYAAESGVWVNGEGGWVNGATMGDRKWYRHEINFIVPENGEAEIEIRVKSKWPVGKDFFFDDIQLEAETAVPDKPTPPAETRPAIPVSETVTIRLPQGYTLSHRVGNTPNVVEIIVPSNVDIVLE